MYSSYELNVNSSISDLVGGSPYIALCAHCMCTPIVVEAQHKLKKYRLYIRNQCHWWRSQWITKDNEHKIITPDTTNYSIGKSASWNQRYGTMHDKEEMLYNELNRVQVELKNQEWYLQHRSINSFGGIRVLFFPLHTRNLLVIFIAHPRVIKTTQTTRSICYNNTTIATS